MAEDIRRSDGTVFHIPDRSGERGEYEVQTTLRTGRHHDPPAVPVPVVEHNIVEIDTEQLKALSNVFSAPKWLRDAGIASWLLAGVALLLVGFVWLAALTATIVDPVVTGLIIATVASPAVGWLATHRVRGGPGAPSCCLRSSRSRPGSS